MNAPLHVELAALCGGWHMPAAEFMAEASRTSNSREIVRLTAVAIYARLRGTRPLLRDTHAFNGLTELGPQYTAGDELRTGNDE
jgi:hypothetical protein